VLKSEGYWALCCSPGNFEWHADLESTDINVGDVQNALGRHTANEGNRCEKKSGELHYEDCIIILEQVSH